MDRTFMRTVVAFLFGLLAGLFIGWWAGTGVEKTGPGEDAEATSVEAPPAPDAGPATDARPADPPPAAGQPPAPPPPGSTPVPAAEERVAELQAEVESLREALESSGVRPPARPVAWPEGRPEKFTEEGFRPLLEQALDACDVPAELRLLECSEPPCIAALRVTSEQWHDALVNTCPPWNENYGTTVSMDESKVDCGGGVSEDIALISPYDHEWREDLEKEETRNVGDRLQERWKAVASDWDCE